MKRLILSIALMTMAVFSACARQNLESNLVGRWELSEVNISRDLVANHLEFFDDGTGIMSLGVWSEGFTWRIDDGRLIFTSPVGMVQIFSIVELSRTTLTYEGVAPMFGNIRATFTRHR